MKKLFLFFFFFSVAYFAKGQISDTTIVKLDQQLKNIQHELVVIKNNYDQSFSNIQTDLLNFNNQFRKGTNLMFLGIATTIAAVLMSNYNPHMEQLITGLTIGGAALTIGGGFIQIDSFKYLGGKNSLTVKVKIDL